VAAVGRVHPSALPAYPQQPAALARLQAFRAGLHSCCSRRADALVDLTDAVLSAPGPVTSLPQLSLEQSRAGPPARLGQPVCRPGLRTDRRRAAAQPAGRLPASSRSAGVRGGRDRLAALRRRVLTRAWPGLPPLAAFGRPADRGWLGVPVDLPGGLCAGLLDRPGGCPPAASLGRHRPHRRRPDPRAACSPARCGPVPWLVFDAGLRLSAVIPGLGRAAGGGAGAAACNLLLLR
jgi:hypothetical protein